MMEADEKVYLRAAEQEVVDLHVFLERWFTKGFVEEEVRVRGVVSCRARAARDELPAVPSRGSSLCLPLHQDTDALFADFLRRFDDDFEVLLTVSVIRE